MLTKVKFLIVFILVAILPLIGVSAYMYVGARNISTASTNENLRSVAVAHVDLVNSIISSQIALVEQVATGGDLIEDLDIYNRTGVLRKPPTEGAAQRVLAVNLRNKRNPLLVDMKALSVSDKNGKIVASSDPTLIGQTQPFGPDVEVNQPADGSDASLTIRRPILLNGVRVGEIEFTSFGRAPLRAILTSTNGTPSTMGVRYVQVVDNKVQASHSGVKADKVDGSSLAPTLIKKENKAGELSSPSGDEFLYNLQIIPGTSSAVLISASTSDVYAAANVMRNVAAFFALIISGFGILIYFLYSRISRGLVRQE